MPRASKRAPIIPRAPTTTEQAHPLTPPATSPPAKDKSTVSATTERGPSTPQGGYDDPAMDDLYMEYGTYEQI
jgi:hypothetical protein